MAGYSGTPLVKKLGIKERHRIALVNAPSGFLSYLGKLPEGTLVDAGALGKQAYDIILFFTAKEGELRRDVPRLARKLRSAGALWVAWPKKASSVPADFTEDGVRAAGLAAGLVDNKVCAVDETWSGLRLVIRLKDRGKITAPRPR